jgi:hypothetical protein
MRFVAAVPVLAAGAPRTMRALRAPRAALQPRHGPVLALFPASRPVSTAAVCAPHGLACCPGCHPREYTVSRVTRAVEFGLRRLKIRRTCSVLRCLGVHSWDEVRQSTRCIHTRRAQACVHALTSAVSQVHQHFERKRADWNLAHPGAPMTLTNSAIDHIRPVDAFQGGCLLEKQTLCNHLSNLQPLLVQDNFWKGRAWDAADESFWRKHIVLRPYPHIYYPRARLPLSQIEGMSACGEPQLQMPQRSSAASPFSSHGCPKS